MNPLVVPTLIAAAALFWLGRKCEQRLTTRTSRRAFIFGALLLAVPGMVFFAYYTKLLGEPICLYRFRALKGTELTVAGLGLLAGFIHGARLKHPLWAKQLRGFTVPAILGVMVLAPFAKPLIRPLNRTLLADRWQDDVCLQSTPSTCGPASAATIARSLGRSVTEAELARDSLTYGGGTENWYLARALRDRGFQVDLISIAPDAGSFPTSAIAGVKLPQGTGHFIAMIGRDAANYIYGDPLTGKSVATFDQLKTTYEFTGFFLVMK
jgi:hypothetical protein